MRHFLYIIGFISIVLMISQSAQAACVVKPSGIFSSHHGRGNMVANHPLARGVLIRARWAEIEKTPGQFDFSRIDTQLRQFKDAGKKWSLGVVAGHSSPSWLKEGVGAEYFTLNSRRAGQVSVPYFWNGYVQERLSVLAKALADRYGDDESLAVVYVPQMTSNGIEGHFNGVPYDVLKHGGLSKKRWVEAVRGASRSFASAFPDKPIVVELHEIYGSIEIPSAVIETLEGDPALHDQIGYGVWWLSGKTQYQNKLLDYMAKADIDLYGQLIGKSSQPRRFGDGTLKSALDQAQELGMRYVEAWNYEFENRVEEQAMAAYDRWANETYPSACE
tara:strand:+ start:411 stop:1406 length:996 start_codon:yes stop_codon:yes gene_type:complete